MDKEKVWEKLFLYRSDSDIDIHRGRDGWREPPLYSLLWRTRCTHNSYADKQIPSSFLFTAKTVISRVCILAHSFARENEGWFSSFPSFLLYTCLVDYDSLSLSLCCSRGVHGVCFWRWSHFYSPCSFFSFSLSLCSFQFLQQFLLKQQQERTTRRRRRLQQLLPIPSFFPSSQSLQDVIWESYFIPLIIIIILCFVVGVIIILLTKSEWRVVLLQCLMLSKMD